MIIKLTQEDCAILAQGFEQQAKAAQAIANKLPAFSDSMKKNVERYKTRALNFPKNCPYISFES